MVKIWFQKSAVQIPFDTFVFNGGEVHVRIKDPEGLLGIDVNAANPGGVYIDARIRNSQDVMTVVMLVDALRNDCGRDYPIGLYMPYVPYGRQDRVCNEGEAFALKAFGRLINSLGFKYVNVLDPHSAVTAGVLDNCHVLSASGLARAALGLGKYDAVVAPDLGAVKRAREVCHDVVQLDKERELATGKIIGLKLVGGDVKGRSLLIVDDICDGGRTFIETAKVLKAHGAARVGLFVTHGIFSQGLDPLKEHLDKVYTTDSWTFLPSCDFLSVAQLRY